MVAGLMTGTLGVSQFAGQRLAAKSSAPSRSAAPMQRLIQARTMEPGKESMHVGGVWLWGLPRRSPARLAGRVRLCGRTLGADAACGAALPPHCAQEWVCLGPRPG